MMKLQRRIPNVIKFVLINGKESFGYCSNFHSKLYGLQSMVQGIGLDDFRVFSYLVFTYDMSWSMKCSFFDSRNVEVVINDSTIGRGVVRLWIIFMKLSILYMLLLDLYIFLLNLYIVLPRKPARFSDFAKVFCC